jgi:hypothetical protein
MVGAGKNLVQTTAIRTRKDGVIRKVELPFRAV